MHVLFKFVGWVICLAVIGLWIFNVAVWTGRGADSGGVRGAAGAGIWSAIQASSELLIPLLIGGAFLVVGKVLTPAKSLPTRRRRIR